LKIKQQLLLTHGLLVVLSLLIVLINVVAFKGVENEAIIINNAGKLRAISYNMVQISNRINDQGENTSDESLSINLKFKMQEFEDILAMLSEGKSGSIYGINHQQTIAKLDKIEKVWREIIKPSYLAILENKLLDESYRQINGEIDLYVSNINEMVTSYSIYSRGKVIRAIMTNAFLVFLIIIVTIYSYKTTNNRIQRPMQVLMKELKELSLIDEEFSKRFKKMNLNEISEMKQYFNEMMYDQLTNSFNRRAGLAKLSRIFQQDNRRFLKMSLCFIDINGLKLVNDQLGHKFGDELIVSVVDCIQQEIRDDDFVIRMGGDEFLIIFKGINEETSENIWERINNRYNTINKQEKRPYIISASHGIVEYDNYEKPELEIIIKNADDKMYIEKKHIKEELKIKIIK